MYYLCKRNQKDNDLMATLLNLISFDMRFDILNNIHYGCEIYAVIACHLKKKKKRFIVGRLQTKNLEPYPKPWILPRESLKVTDHWVIP